MNIHEQIEKLLLLTGATEVFFHVTKTAVWIMAKHGEIESTNLLCILDDDTAWEYAAKRLKEDLDNKEKGA